MKKGGEEEDESETLIFNFGAFPIKGQKVKFIKGFCRGKDGD